MRVLALFIAGWLVAARAHAAQELPPFSHEETRSFDSGLVSNTTSARKVVISFPVEVPAARWLRLSFGEITLAGDEAQGTGSYLRITSMLDGASQTLHARHVREWRDASAYFNGDALLVEVIAEPGTGPNRVRLASATVGTWSSFTICGATDDRVLSGDPRSGRALPAGCTAWLINDCGHCLLTAGHCVEDGLNVIEFNVPLSTFNGSLVHPPPEDQYSIDVGSQQSNSGAVGDDWGYFGCYPNPVTNLTPFEKQHATCVLATPVLAAGTALRVTGFGLDSTPSIYNEVQQTASGPLTNTVGTELRYQVDTTGGNSGSAVEWMQTGLAIGIHTNAGCNTTSGSFNSGTSLSNPGLQAALASPLGVCNSVCTSSVNAYCSAKVNSQACTPAITWTGNPSASGGAGSFVLHAASVINNKTGLLLYGILPAATPFQGGTLCIANPLRRTPAQNSGGSAGADNCSGTYAFDMGARIASGSDVSLHVGTTAFAQWYQRDPASVPFPVGLTAGVAFTIGP